jgi:hypothetical protein
MGTEEVSMAVSQVSSCHFDIPPCFSIVAVECAVVVECSR